MTSKYYPMTFSPVLKHYIWGGRNLEKRLGRELPPGITAESWEIAGHEDGTTIVENGRFAGRPLTEVHNELGIALIGQRNLWAHERGKFPLLIKLLDAQQQLSVQVHPDDDYALKHEGNELGKTEMWVVLYAEKNAKVILGVKKSTSKEMFTKAIPEGNLENYLHEIPVKTGDHICVPAGSLHAIMSGALLAEIQQNSNTTYRVYDWQRRGPDGSARPLHIQQAMDVINFQQVEPNLQPAKLIAKRAGTQRFLLCKNKYFTAERIELAKGAIFSGHCDGSTLEIWGTIGGTSVVQNASAAVELPAIKFTLLPAAMGEFTLQSDKGATLLRAYVE